LGLAFYLHSPRSCNRTSGMHGASICSDYLPAVYRALFASANSLLVAPTICPQCTGHVSPAPIHCSLLRLFARSVPGTFRQRKSTAIFSDHLPAVYRARFASANPPLFSLTICPQCTQARYASANSPVVSLTTCPHCTRVCYDATSRVCARSLGAPVLGPQRGVADARGVGESPKP